ncbi:hydroxypyruvate isomerase family protein [Bacillus sp. DNRA2]|uniref:hydroxypyruvate isomerase family protein n=1 Tax=Bacillus sp. DNRA2 TaxID=2723053 RepID=UPI00145EC917|nr:hydroxypyruvate isomerase family protein [Bacillus sp. DNRA2]NMD69887.1 hydroxypyruvate isomerase family protein [Bacillus sp. DNRA2]
MNKYAVNLSTIFTEVPFIERFKKAKQAGFNFVECQFPYSVPVSTIREELEMNQLSLVLINIPAGDWENGERGLAIYPERIPEFKESVATGIEYAQGLGVKKLHCLAGIVPVDMNPALARKTYIENLTFAAEQLAAHGMTLLIEPINQFDMPGYFLNDIKEAVEIVEEINLPNVKLQFDFYHIQKTKGNLLANFTNYMDKIEHIQVADVPGRHEPNTGEIYYQRVLAEVCNNGYRGFIGLEYIPLGKSEDSFSWIELYQRGEK